MSPKFGLALLLLCVVLLGLSNAERRQQQQQRQGGGYRDGGKYIRRNLARCANGRVASEGGPPGIGGGPPGIDGGEVDCNQNNLAHGGPDRPRPQKG